MPIRLGSFFKPTDNCFGKYFRTLASDPMRDYSDCYAILGITSDADWKTLRAHYRRLIGQWHPDRFSSDATGKAIAEERSKEITLAYQALEQYHRDHGVLPPLERVAAAPNPGAQRKVPEGQPSAPAGATAAEPNTPTSKSAKRKPRHLYRLAFALAIPIAAAYFVQGSNDEPEPSRAESAERTPEPEVAPQRAPTPEDRQSPSGIRVGSTLGEVYAIQGVPNATERDTWYYGKSLIRFDKGRVVSWEEHLDNPLRIDRHRVALLHERLFGVGSTKDEVRAIQGAPIAETGNVWYYGSSKVYFENGYVVHWEESPMQPLRVAR